MFVLEKKRNNLTYTEGVTDVVTLKCGGPRRGSMFVLEKKRNNLSDTEGVADVVTLK